MLNPSFLRFLQTHFSDASSFSLNSGHMATLVGSSAAVGAGVGVLRCKTRSLRCRTEQRRVTHSAFAPDGARGNALEFFPARDIVYRAARGNTLIRHAPLQNK